MDMRIDVHTPGCTVEHVVIIRGPATGFVDVPTGTRYAEVDAAVTAGKSWVARSQDGITSFEIVRIDCTVTPIDWEEQV